jgi:hypothetical protein
MALGQSCWVGEVFAVSYHLVSISCAGVGGGGGWGAGGAKALAGAAAQALAPAAQALAPAAQALAAAATGPLAAAAGAPGPPGQGEQAVSPPQPAGCGRCPVREWLQIVQIHQIPNNTCTHLYATELLDVSLACLHIYVRRDTGYCVSVAMLWVSRQRFW